MRKINKKANTLIKRRGLILRLKKVGIKRINKEALSFLENYLEEEFEKIVRILKEEIDTQGKKTLKKGEIKRLKLKEQKSWEI